MKILWFIPTHGDSRYLGTSKGARAATFDYFKQVAIAADSLGYEGVLLPTGRSCEDSWVLAASLIDATRRLKFRVALRPCQVLTLLGAREWAGLGALLEAAESDADLRSWHAYRSAKIKRAEELVLLPVRHDPLSVSA